jgi:hypothetical protein
MMDMLIPFLRGATAVGCAVAALFFMRYWRTTADRLFFWFAAAFWLLALDYTVLGLLPRANEWRLSVFAVRLLAFCLILFGMISKNRPAQP